MSPTPSKTRLVLVPSYNTGAQLLKTVREALEFWNPVWVVIDGSTDGSLEMLRSEAAELPGLRIIKLESNRGKGGAVLAGMTAALEEGFTHALVMDSDGQHPADRIRAFMELSEQKPGAMVLGLPEFDATAPRCRRYGRCLGNFWANVETLWAGIGDSLFGFRLYPVRESVEILSRIRGGRRFDFDTQLVVRLCWRGIQPIKLRVPVRYFAPAQGGVSHFRYVRDNALLARTHLCLVAGMLARLPKLLRRRRARRKISGTVAE